MSARLVFFRRTQQEMLNLPGEVYFDVNGRNLGRLSSAECFVDLPAGQYQIRMYMSHGYGSLMGFADILVNLQEGESLMLRYVAPAMMNQPGHIMVFNYDPASANTMAWNIDSQITAALAQQAARNEKAKRDSNNIVGWMIGIGVGAGLIIALSYAIISSSLFSLF